MMRKKHLTAEEMIKYMDTSNLSEDYLLWLEEVAEHVMGCSQCQERLHKAMAVDSICDEEGLAAGLKLLEKEEEIRRDILVASLRSLQEQEKVAELIRCIQNGRAERFVFSALTSLGRAGAVRGADAVSTMEADSGEGIKKTPEKQKVILEQYEDKLLVKISGVMGKDRNTLKEEKTPVLVCLEGDEPKVEEAVWDEACGQFVTELDNSVMNKQFEIWIL